MKQEPVAIVGMACIFPQAPDLRTFWRNVLAGVDAVGEPLPEWDADRYLDSGRIQTSRGGFLRDLYRFDPKAFGIMPNSVDGGEPDQFLALRVAHEALVDAGYAGPGHDHRETGIVLGHSTYLHRGQASHIQHHIVLDQTLELLRTACPEVGEEALQAVRARLEAKLPKSNADVAPGLVPNVMTGRIANRLDFKGPNYLVDAACSSSLLAVGAALDELRSGRSRMMLAGGVNASLPAEVSVIFTQLGALSRRGSVRPFAAGADGTLLGEGLGIVALKRESDALADGDRVYAVLHGVGQASDGRGLGLLAPSVDGEALAIRRAYASTGIDPATVELIEAHGTGIPLGDRTEIAALKSVLGERRGEQGSVALGSVKSMISHCIPAAGIAGLIKTALALHHRVLAPTLCEEVDPSLGIAETPLYVNTAPRPWIARPGAPRRAGIDSFGFGGINAHAILEEAPAAACRPAALSAWPSELCVFSAASAEELRGELDRLLAALERRDDLALGDLAATLARRDAGGEHRLALVARDARHLADMIRQASKRLERGDDRWATRGGAVYAREPMAGSVAFLFPGEGSQYLGMFEELALQFEEVREWLGFWRGLYPDPPGAGRTDLLYPPASELTDERRKLLTERLHDMDVGSEAVFVGAQAMRALLERLGVAADAMVGHSTGESSALVAAGAIPAEDRARIGEVVRELNHVYRRLLEDEAIPTGALLTVGALGREELHRHVAEVGGDVVVAMDNCSNQQVLFGDRDAIRALGERLSAAGGICTLLPFDRGYHTPRFAAVSAAFRAFYDAIGLQAPKVALYSCATTGPFPADAEGARALAADQWARTVRFRETVERMHGDGVRYFVEVGPSGNLSAFVNDVLARREYLALPTDKRGKRGIEQLLTVLAHLYVNRKWLEPRRLFEGRACAEVALEGERPPAPGMLLDNTLPVLHLGDEDRAALRGVLAGARVAPAPAPSGALEELSSWTAGFAQMRSWLDRQQAELASWTAPPAAEEPAETFVHAPLLGELLEHDGRRLRVSCQLDLAEDRYLRHHVLSGRVSAADPELLGLACVPLTVSLEILAEACALLAGSTAVRTIENVRVLDWIALDDERATLEVVAERIGDDGTRYAARLLRGADVVLTAELGFEADWRAPALAPLAERRAYRWASDELYTTGMFHGPLFQSVARVDGWSDEGIDASLSAVGLGGFLREGEEPGLVLNPVLLDAMGQLAAFWIAQQVGTDFNSFPSSIERIELYRDRPRDLAGAVLRGRQRALDPSSSHGARSWQFECVDGDGAPLFRASNLTSVFFPVPHAFYRVRHDPLHGSLGEPWLGLARESVLLWRVEHLPADFCQQSSGIFLRILAHCVLSEQERREWRALEVPARRRREWLLARVCLKEAVRQWVADRTGRWLHPADVVVVHDEQGAPAVDGWWADELVDPPAVSLSHDRHVVLAAVALPDDAVGVDVETVGDAHNTDLLESALAPCERDALHRHPRGEWPERVLRLWCAKESAAKALGTGLLGRPEAFVVSFGRDDWREGQVEIGGSALDVTLARDRDLVVALAAHRSRAAVEENS